MLIFSANRARAVLLACWYRSTIPAVAWRVPIVDIHGRWHPMTKLERTLPWSGAAACRGNSSAPVMSFYSFDGGNRLTFALSDAMNAVQMTANVQGDMQLEAQLVMNGLYCGDPSGYHDPRAAKLEKTCEEW